MNFKTWIEDEASLGAMSPEMAPPAVNRGTNTPASDEVKRTGLQPQVDAQEPDTADNPDDLLAIDDALADVELKIPDGGEDGDTKVNKFQKLWQKLKDKWDQIKMDGEDELPSEKGFGDMDDPQYDDMMRSHPNMVPGADQGPHGPGIFGQS